MDGSRTNGKNLASGLLLASALLWTALLGTSTAPLEAADGVRVRPLKGFGADVATMILAGREGGSIRAALWSAPVVEDDGRVSLPFWLEVEGSGLLDDSQGEDLDVEVYAYALTSKGAVKGYLAQKVRLSLNELGEVLFAGGLKLAGHVDIASPDPAASYQLRVLVREPRSQRFGIRIAPFELPSPDEPVVLVPRFAETSASWIVVREAPHGEPGRGVGLLNAPPPSALPVLAVGPEIPLELWSYGLGPVRNATFRLLDVDRKAVSGGELRLGKPPRDEGPERRPAALTLPEVATGTYFLELALGRGKAPVPLLPVFVLAADEALPDVAWTELKSLSQRTSRHREALELEDVKRAAQQRRRIAGAYREVLAGLAAGTPEAALADLRRLEGEVREAAAEDTGLLEQLTEAELGVLAGLAEHDAESLVPPLALHMEAHDAYVGERAYPLAAHSREVILFLSRRYARDAPGEPAKALAAQALASLGAYLQEAQLTRPGRLMLAEALSLDEKNTSALLLLAVAHERRGDYAEAVSYLRRLVEVDPRSEEGRLRLALCLARSGATDEAARLLRRVIDQGKTEWLLTLAYQELARLYLAGGRLDDAVALLGAARARLPGQGRLRLQLAYALDRSGQGRRGRELLAAAPFAPSAESPRFVYNRQSREDHVTAPVELTRGAVVRLPVLAAALQAIGGGAS